MQISPTFVDDGSVQTVLERGAVSTSFIDFQENRNRKVGSVDFEEVGKGVLTKEHCSGV